jgi:hypothetical protein
MGVFKSMRDLQKQAKQIEATMPPLVFTAFGIALSTSLISMLR